MLDGFCFLWYGFCLDLLNVLSKNEQKIYKAGLTFVLVVAQPQKAVILLTGRYAGRKAVIVRNYDDGVHGRPYGHAIVCGLAKYPRKV